MPTEQKSSPTNMPPPSAAFAIIAAALIEHEQDVPGFIERTRARLEGEVNLSAAVRLRGPESEPAVRQALREGLAWVAILTVASEAEAPARRRRWFWA